METPSPGRRRDQQGPDSISVAELMRRTPISLKHEQLADELLQNDDADVPPPAGRVAFGTLGALLLLGAAVATSTIVAQPADTPRPAAAAPITGGLALRPDLVRDARWPFAGNGGFAGAAAGDTTVQRTESPRPMVANPAAGSAESAREVIEEFYRRLSGDATGALSMVAPELFAGQQASVLRAWRDAESVAVDEHRIRIEPGGAVLAEVEVRYPAGDRVRLEQRLTVESDSDPKITGAELLGARHTSH